jgi:PAS domain-containing protein
VPFFICPSCGNREQSTERTAGFTGRPKGCARCGFGFVFELLDDYYPAPEAAFFVCDREARILDVGRGGFELTGLKDEEVIGRPVREVLGLRWERMAQDGEPSDGNGDGAADPIETTLEWGVRSLGRPVAVHAEGDLPAEAVADLFPAYDQDGGLLIVLTPR